MKASALIRALTSAVHDHGDGPVRLSSYVPDEGKEVEQVVAETSHVPAGILAPSFELRGKRDR